MVVALVSVGAIVWASPEDSAPRQALGPVVRALDPDPSLQEQHEVLLAEYASSQDDLTHETSANDALEQQVAELEESLAITNDALASARARQASATIPASPVAPTPALSIPATPPATSTPPDPGTTPEPGAAAEPEVTAPALAALVQPEHPYYGMYTQQAPFNWATYDDTSSRVGFRPNVVGYFGGWDEDFRGIAVERAWERDTLPILTWESRPIGASNNVVDEPEYSLPRIMAGDFDAYLHQYARDIVALGLPLGIRFNHEMNGTWYPWSESNSSGAPINGNNPGDYVRVWQYVHDIFEAEGANEYVFWIWAPNIVNNLPTAHRTVDHLTALYPGDEYVDWVGLSGYLRPPYREGQTFTFDYTFGPSLEQLRGLTDKPIFLAEIGASETDGHKPAWVSSFFDGLADPANDDIVGFAWFNLAITTYVEGVRATNDWRIDSRTDTLDAFREGLLDPALGYALRPY